MKNVALYCLIILASISCNEVKQQKNSATDPEKTAVSRVLAIFSHPDDESTVAPLLSKLDKDSVAVWLIIATDGRLGVTEHAGIPAGDSLAEVRSGEMRCAAEILGIDSLFMLGFHDQLRSGESFAEFNNSIRGIRQDVEEILKVFKPEIVLTWGPNGYTGHPDHRIVSTIVSEVVQYADLENRPELLYPGLPVENMVPEAETWLTGIDKDLLRVRIPVSEENRATARQAWLCHSSQYTPSQVDAMVQLTEQVMRDTVFLFSANPRDPLRFELLP